MWIVLNLEPYVPKLYKNLIRFSPTSSEEITATMNLDSAIKLLYIEKMKVLFILAYMQ